MNVPDDSYASLPPDPRRKVSPPAGRNREPILAVLRRVFPSEGAVLEAASGTGEHAVYFAAALAGLEWQPTDVDTDNLTSIAAWTEATRVTNVRAPLRVDLSTPPIQDAQRYGAGFCANLVHIAPWTVCVNLMAFMSSHLTTNAPLVTYGPYKVNGEHTSESNVKFEQWLWAQNPEYGVRDMAQVSATAREFGLHLTETVTMPANNFCLVFRKN